MFILHVILQKGKSLHCLFYMLFYKKVSLYIVYFTCYSTKKVSLYIVYFTCYSTKTVRPYQKYYCHQLCRTLFCWKKWHAFITSIINEKTTGRVHIIHQYILDITSHNIYILFFLFSLNIFYLPIKQTKWIRHKLNKLMKSSPNYNMLQ